MLNGVAEYVSSGLCPIAISGRLITDHADSEGAPIQMPLNIGMIKLNTGIWIRYERRNLNRVLLETVMWYAPRLSIKIIDVYRRWVMMPYFLVSLICSSIKLRIASISSILKFSFFEKKETKLPNDLLK